jgi:trk system potassium uptake protein TrkH
MAMGLGGASGSTANGIKVIRAISITRGVRERIRDPFPEKVLSGSIDESASGRHSSANYHNASLVAFLWVGIYLLGVFALLAVLPIGPGPEASRSGTCRSPLPARRGTSG